MARSHSEKASKKSLCLLPPAKLLCARGRVGLSKQHHLANSSLALEREGLGKIANDRFKLLLRHKPVGHGLLIQAERSCRQGASAGG